jgi:hypothetical protein
MMMMDTIVEEDCWVRFEEKVKRWIEYVHLNSLVFWFTSTRDPVVDHHPHSSLGFEEVQEVDIRGQIRGFSF